MSSIFNNISTRIFCISGELSDVFCLPNGWIVNFDELLNIRLKSQGFSGVIFCSTQRSMTYAVDRAGAAAMSVLTGKKKETSPAPVPALSEASDYYSWLDEDTSPAPHAQEPVEPEDSKIVYTHSIAKDQLSAAADRFMKDISEQKAIVFTSLEDLIRLATTEEGRKLLERFEEWKALPNENRNICILLSKTLDSCGLQNMLHDNRVAVLESLFLRKNEFNRNSSLCIGAPLNDEIERLLEHLRIVGHSYTDIYGNTKRAHLRFHRNEHSRIVRMLSFCSRDSGFTQLKAMKEILERFMENKGDEVWIYPDTVALLYPDSAAGIMDDTDPMDILRERRGWEPAYNVINSFITNYRVLYPDGADSERTKELNVDRFEASSVQTRGAVPNFVLEGPPGVGKTAIANLIGRILQREGIIRSGHTVIGSRDKLVGEYVGSTAIRTASLIEEAQEGVLLVDEVYSIAESGEGQNSYCDEVFNTIVAAMTNSNYHFCVIFAGYADRMPEVWKMNEGLFSRFGASNVITLKEYEPPLLQSIFESQFGKEEGLSSTVTVLSDDVKRGLPVFFENYFADRDRKNFGNARDINNLVSDVKRAASYRRTCGDADGDPSVITVERRDFESRKSLFEKRGFSAEDIYSKLHEYVGMGFLEEMFNDQLALRVECIEKGLPYPGPAHMIWAGNPGTGKSTAAQLTAELYHSLGILGSAEPICVDASELTSVYVSGSAGKMSEKIDEACRKNAVLIIEEAYQLLEKGGEDAIHAMLNRMETDRANFNLILILYKDKVKDFLDKNPGLASRLKVYEFPDYDEKQL
ncbi:MAG: AAA family ATPase, partial [Oscillospiraceae bacterium]|nr:AAA family ATPase [Oscillospiraceae bacterium]